MAAPNKGQGQAKLIT